jgi:hypothetical protein
MHAAYPYPPSVVTLPTSHFRSAAAATATGSVLFKFSPGKARKGLVVSCVKGASGGESLGSNDKLLGSTLMGAACVRVGDRFLFVWVLAQ